MAVFEDNAVVTAEDLNNVAVDLGFTDFSSFSDEKFGVDKLNEITADLVGKGILTAGERCVPIVSGGKVYIKSGIIVFGSGAKIRIESTVEVAAAAGDYIYAFNDVTTGKASIEVGSGLPTSGDFVSLAQVDSFGTLSDMRQMSVANVDNNALSTAEIQNSYVEQTVVLDRMVDWRVYDENGERESYAVVPELPQCRVLILKSAWAPNINCVPVGVELTENFQVLLYEGDGFRLEVKKVDGLLYIRGFNPGSSYASKILNKGDTFKFLLA